MSQQPSQSPEPSTPIIGEVFGPEFRYVQDCSWNRTHSSRVSPFLQRASDAHLSKSALITMQEKLRNPGTILPVIASPTYVRLPTGHHLP